ncbi:MAG: hypothetical protein LC722_04345 [Actinobacteria bacterium]|nr:hypothetical protein [Actinomycetota bacterium]
MNEALARKLRITQGMTLRTVGAPRDTTKLDLPVQTRGSGPYQAVLFFAATRRDLDAGARAAVAMVQPGGLLWVAYPKAGQLGTDLKRDIVWEAMKPTGWGPVTQVSLDEVWSALRFKPESEINRKR